MILEICAGNYQSAINAEKAGAHRIELCAELNAGGLTPSYGLLKKVMQDITIPNHVLIRPRSGNFVYSPTEVDMMIENIKICKKLNCAGIVCGALTQNFEIDIETTQRLIEASGDMFFTFHRAFDRVNNAEKALDTLIKLGVKRILTSGLKLKAEDGLETLIELKAKTKGKITLMPGGGINPDNAKLFKDAGFTEIHASASAPIPSAQKHPLFQDKFKKVSNINTIKQILNTIK